MATTTTKLALRKPAGTDLIDVALDIGGNMDKLDDHPGIKVVTSGTRPGSPWEGQLIYETDTELYMTWLGAAWVPLPGQRLGSQVVGANTPAAGLHDCGTAFTFTMPTVAGSRKVRLIAVVENFINGTTPTLHDIIILELTKSDNTLIKNMVTVAHGVFGTGYHDGTILLAEVDNSVLAAGSATVKLRVNCPTGTMGISTSSTIHAEAV